MREEGTDNSGGLFIPGHNEKKFIDGLFRWIFAVHSVAPYPVQEKLSGITENKRAAKIALGEDLANLRKVIDQSDTPIYGLPVLLTSGVPVDALIDAADKSRPINIPRIQVHSSWRVENDQSAPILPEFSMRQGKTYDEQDVLFSLAVAIMQKENDFGSIVQGRGMFYDGRFYINSSPSTPTPAEMITANIAEGMFTQIDKILELPDNQQVANALAALAIDGQRRFVKSSKEKRPFGGKSVRVPINPRDKEFGRMEDANCNMSVPVVPVIISGASSDERHMVFGKDTGYRDPNTGYIVLQTLDTGALAINKLLKTA
jgi:hypothetical protein